MRRIAVINQKGGVGKTTTTANLGAALAQLGLDVLLVDLDPQAHLSLHFGVELTDEQFSIYDVLTASTPIDQAIIKIDDHATLIPADIDLAGAEAELVAVPGREVLLREALERHDQAYDCMLIDCPPSLGTLTINALVCADEVLIPLQTHFLALQGLSRLLETVTLVRRRINPTLTVGGIVLCMYESTTRLAGEVVEDLTGFLASARDTDVPWSDARLYDTHIRRNIKLAEASSYGQTVFGYAPRSNGALDYQRLAIEMFELEEVKTTPPVSLPDEVDKPVVEASPPDVSSSFGEVEVSVDAETPSPTPPPAGPPSPPKPRKVCEKQVTVPPTPVPDVVSGVS